MTGASSDASGKPGDDRNLWKGAVQALEVLMRAEALLRAQGVDRVSLFRDAFRSSDKNSALVLARNLTTSELQSLFPELVFLATSGDPSAARGLIHRIPKEWVLQNIESAAEAELQKGTEWEFRRILELYEELDPALTQKLARRAALRADPDIKEAGEDFLEGPKDA